jgi:hypothetical protein
MVNFFGRLYGLIVPTGKGRRDFPSQYPWKAGGAFPSRILRARRVLKPSQILSLAFLPEPQIHAVRHYLAGNCVHPRLNDATDCKDRGRIMRAIGIPSP